MTRTEENLIELLARADPVRPEDVARRIDATGSRALLDSVMAAAPPGRSASRPRRVALGVVGVALAGALLLLTSLIAGREDLALAIQKTDRYVSLRIEDPSAGASRMNEELRERGIDIEVQMVPVLPADVGHWVGGRAVWPGVSADGDQHRLGDERIRELNDAARGVELIRDPDDPALVRVPTGFEGHFLLYAGREARPGERPWIDGNPPGAF